MTSDDLKRLLLALYVETDEVLRRNFKRSLPFQDGLFDRWERAQRLGFGNGASVYNSAMIFGHVYVGEQSWVGPNVLLDGSGGRLEIGSFCSLAAGVHVYTHDTVAWALSGGRAPASKAPVKIGDRCYVGSQSIVKKGVSIGNECVIAANSFVNENVPDRSIVGGVPARLLGNVEIIQDRITLCYHDGRRIPLFDCVS